MPDTKRKIEVMAAYAEGKDIEYRHVGDDDWMHCTQPLWDWAHFDFRVAEEKEQEGVVYAVIVNGESAEGTATRVYRNTLLYDVTSAGYTQYAVYSKKSRADAHCKEMQDCYPTLSYKVERVEVIR